MIKRDLITKISKTTGFKRSDTELLINKCLDIIREELKAGGNVNINQFGKFYIKNYPGRDVITPQGKTLKVDARKIPGFKPGKFFKDYVK